MHADGLSNSYSMWPRAGRRDASPSVRSILPGPLGERKSHMKRIHHVTRPTLALASALVLLFWHNVSPAAEMAIAKVNMQTLFKQSASIRASFQETEKTTAEAASQLEKLSLEISALEQALEKEKGKEPSAERQELEKNLKTKKENLKSEAEATRARLRLKRVSEENMVNMRIREIVARIAREEKLTLVIPEQMALYSQGVPDITSKVLKALDAGVADKKKEEKQPTPQPEEPKP